MSNPDVSLRKKSKATGIPFGILKQVYNRGMAAWKTGHRPGATQAQWGHARVNSFIAKKSGTWGKADKDLADKAKKAMKEGTEMKKTYRDILDEARAEMSESQFFKMRHQHFGMSHRDLLHKRVSDADEAKKRREKREKEHAEFMAQHYDAHGNVKMPGGN